MHLQITELEADLKKLKSFARRADKIEHKKTVLLPKWLPITQDHINEINKNKPATSDNPIFAYCIIWLFDSGDLSTAIDYAFTAIKHGQPMPAIIRRQWPGFIADTVFDWAEQQAEQGNSIQPYFGRVFEHVKNDWKLPEQVTSKFYKFAGYALLRSTNGTVTPSHIGNLKQLREADALLAKAAELHKHAGVKTARNKIAMRIRALTELNAQ